jgi:tripartite-type tricarboxylate transporter receptor subunit TctC
MWCIQEYRSAKIGVNEKGGALTSLHSCIVAIALCVMTGGAFGQGGYPVKPPRLVVPFASGGGADILARLVAQTLAEPLGQNVIIDNRPGAAGILGTELVVKAPADGYTLLMGAPGLAINPSLYVRLPYDALRDLAPVSLVGAVPNLVVVHPSVPARTIRELVALARANPGRLNYASPGRGTSLHFAVELFRSRTGIDLVHVAYKGGAPALIDLVGGHVDLMFDVLPASLPYVKSGRLRALAITAAQRSPLLPQLPTVAEAGIEGFQAITWNGLLLPASTPRGVITRVHQALHQVVNASQMRERYAAIGTDPVTNSPEEFSAFLREETTKWARVAKAAGIKPE